MYAGVWILGFIAAVCGQQTQSPTIDCANMGLKSGHSFVITNSALPHEVTCVRSTTTIDVTVKAEDGADITDVMVKVFITNSSSGMFLSPDDGDRFAVGCNGQALISTDRSTKSRIEGLWFNSLGLDLTTKQPTCVLTLVDSRNRAWEAVSVPSITSEEYERQRLEALLGPGNNAFASDAQQPAQETTSPAVNADPTEHVDELTGAQPNRQPDKILNIPLSAVMFEQFNRMPKNRAVPSNELPGVGEPTQHASNTLSPDAQARLRASGRPAGAQADVDFMNPFGNNTTARDPEQPNPTAAPTTTTTTTALPTTTTTTPTTTTTTPTTTTTTPTTTTTTPTTTTTTPTTTTTTPRPTTTTSTMTTTTTTTRPTTTRSTQAPRRATRPPTTAATTVRRRTRPPVTTPTTTTPPRTTTTTQPANLDQGEITVEGRTYGHHCLNGNLKRVLIPHTGCRYYMTLMNGLPGAFSRCPVSQQEGALCFDPVTCSCTACYPTVCPPPPINSERRFSVTVFNSQRDPIGAVQGEFIPNGRGGYNENIQINGIIDPGYLPLRNPDGSIQTTASPATFRRNNNGNNRRGPTRTRGNNGRSRNNQNQPFGLESLLGFLGAF